MFNLAVDFRRALFGLVLLGLAGCGGANTAIPSTDISKNAAPGHIKALKDERFEVRRDAAHSLWQIGALAPEATPALIEALHDQEPEVREEAARALKATDAIRPILDR